MVAVRHWCGGGGEQKSTLILLCEDGSLRMYAASNEHTGYWLSPAIQPTHAPRRRPRLLTHHSKGKAQQVGTDLRSEVVLRRFIFGKSFLPISGFFQS